MLASFTLAQYFHSRINSTFDKMLEDQEVFKGQKRKKLKLNLWLHTDPVAVTPRFNTKESASSPVNDYIIQTYFGPIQHTQCKSPSSKSDWYCRSYGLSQFKTVTFNYHAPCRPISVFLLQQSKAPQCIIPPSPVNIGPAVSHIITELKIQSEWISGCNTLGELLGAYKQGPLRNINNPGEYT